MHFCLLCIVSQVSLQFFFVFSQTQSQLLPTHLAKLEYLEAHERFSSSAERVENDLRGQRQALKQQHNVEELLQLNRVCSARFH